MKLIELYERILNYVGVVVDEKGATAISIAGRTEPTMINGKRLVMPTHEALHSTGTDIVIFHPFQEYVNRGESDVVRKLRRIINVRLNLAVTAIMDGLLRLLESPGDHKHLDHQQRELLIAVTAGKLKNSNGESVLRAKLATMVAKRFPEQPDSFCCNIFMKKSGTFKGIKHQRIGVVSFGFYETLEKNSSQFNKDQYATLTQLFEFIFPESNEELSEAWNGYSDSAECPWLDCLLKSSYNVVSRIRELTSLYSDFMTSPETGKIPDELIFDVSWIDELDNLQAYKQEILLIPSQAGNEGAVETTQAAATNPVLAAAANAANASIRAATPNVQQPQQPQQVYQNHPVQNQMQPMMPYNEPVQTKMTADGRIDLSGPGGFPAHQPFMMGSGITGPIQQQMLMNQMQQQMMMNPGLMAAYSNNGLLPSPQQMYQQQQQPYYPGQVQPYQPPYLNQAPMQAGLFRQPYQPAAYGVPGIQGVQQPGPNITAVHNV